MKSRIPNSWLKSFLALVLLGCSWAARAQDAPQSVFNVPRTPQEGKDPFFPTSTRMFVVVAKSIEPAGVAVPRGELFLKGFSGPINNRLAIINNYTFAAGESADVRTSSGRVRVHCVEIKSDSVIIRVGDEKRELHLRNGV